MYFSCPTPPRPPPHPLFFFASVVAAPRVNGHLLRMRLKPSDVRILSHTDSWVPCMCMGTFSAEVFRPQYLDAVALVRTDALLPRFVLPPDKATTVESKPVGEPGGEQVQITADDAQAGPAASTQGHLMRNPCKVLLCEQRSALTAVHRGLCANSFLCVGCEKRKKKPCRQRSDTHGDEVHKQKVPHSQKSTSVHKCTRESRDSDARK